MTDYKLNDKIWFVPDGYLIVIECRIIEVDDSFRKKEPQAYLFYELDEPVGHDVSVTELYKTKDEALKELRIRHQEALNENDPLVHLMPTLNDYRISRIEFIVSTWEDCQDHEQTFIKRSWYLKLRSKEQGKDWFNISNL